NRVTEPPLLSINHTAQTGGCLPPQNLRGDLKRTLGKTDTFVGLQNRSIVHVEVFVRVRLYHPSIHELAVPDWNAGLEILSPAAEKALIKIVAPLVLQPYP